VGSLHSARQLYGNPTKMHGFLLKCNSFRLPVTSPTLLLFAIIPSITPFPIGVSPEVKPSVKEDW